MDISVTANKALVKETLEECFATDPDFLGKWHIAAPGGLAECVAKTVSDVEGMDDTFKLYRMYDNNNLVAYWGTECNGEYLNLIFVKPSYRTKDFMSKFWTEIKNTMKPKFYTAVYSKNKPAVSFYAKHCSAQSPHDYQGFAATLFLFDCTKEEETGDRK